MASFRMHATGCRVVRQVLIVALALGGMTTARVPAVELAHSPAPVDNPLKGLVPYVGASGADRFPHSMEFHYLAWKDLMPARGRFDWRPLETVLDEVRGRGNQLIFRIYAEYPGKGTAIPDFLVREGVKVTSWKAEGAAVHTPDYRDPRLRSAMQDFLKELGAKYDGDPRVAFLTAGMLGLWGEWHTYPREDLWAPEEVQAEVMTAFEKSFPTTRILLRYPAGEKTWKKAPNAGRPFGYHDDSFAWATLGTGREEDSWYFVPALVAAGAESKWKQFPVGGEIRPELWRQTFTNSPHPKAQDFAECVRQTHVSWLMDSGLFDRRFPLDAERKERALKAVRGMGYELHISEMRLEKGELVVTVENRGVAPFYYDWPVEVRVSAPNVRTKPQFPKWRLSTVLPGAPVTWRMPVGVAGEVTVRLRVANPMEGGKPLRFANAGEDEWVTARF